MLAINGIENIKEGDKMAEISQSVNIEMLEKLPDGTYKRKYPKTRADDGTTFDEHLAEIASEDNVHGLRGMSLALGQNSEASSNKDRPIALGHSAKATNWDSIAVGYDAKSTGQEGIVVGQQGLGSAVGSVVLGLRSEASGKRSIAIGNRVTVQNENEGVFGGVSDFDTTTKWIVPGNFTVNGTKNFEMPHPKPEKKATHRIRHGAVESPTAGDTLYRYKVIATKDSDKQTVDLPDYFIHLNKDIQIFVSPQGHFGNGYGVLNRETEQIEVHCQYEGEYNILVIGTRNDDHPSVQDWDIKGVEREIGESWTGETYAFSVDEIMEVEEIKEEV